MKKKENRSFARTNTLLPFLARRLPADECDNLECCLSLGGIVFEDAPPPPAGDERLCHWLNMINAKLDYLISLTLPERKGFVTMKFEPLNISAAGMAIVTEDLLQIGDVIEIRIVLQAYPAKILYLYGEVVRVQPIRGKQKRFTAGLQFMNMTDEVRKEILAFDFKKHWEKLISIKRP